MSSPDKTNSSAAISHVPWGPVAALIVSIGSFFLAQFLGGFAAFIYPGIKGWDAKQTLEWLDKSVIAQFLLGLFIYGITFGLIYAFMRRRKAKLASVGLIRPKWRDVGYALIGLAIYIPLLIMTLVGLRALFPNINWEQEQELGFQTAHSGLDLSLVFISLAILPPLVEEFVTRGFLYSGLKRKLPTFLAIIITSLLFAAVHLQFGSSAGLLWVAAFDTFILSLVLIYLREATGRLWASIGLHFIKNTIAFFAIFVFK